MAQGKADLKSVKAEFSSRSALFNAESSAHKYRGKNKAREKAVFLQSLSVSRKKSQTLLQIFVYIGFRESNFLFKKKKSAVNLKILEFLIKQSEH